jgi:hypothetical protein
MTDIEVYTLAGDKYIIPSVTKVYELIDYLKNIYSFTKIHIISNGNILEKTLDITDINSSLCAVMSKANLLIICDLTERENYSPINIYDTISNNILSTYNPDNFFINVDAYDHILLYVNYETNTLNIIDIYDNVHIGVITFKEKIFVCKIMKEIPIKYILCILEDNSIHIYSINNLNTPVNINNIMMENKIFKNTEGTFYFSNSSNKIAYLREKESNYYLCIIDLKINTHILIELNNCDYYQTIFDYAPNYRIAYDPLYILSFSRDETMLLAHSSLNIIVYNTSDGSTLYRLDMEKIISIVWHPFEPTLIFLRSEDNILHENDFEFDYDDGYESNHNNDRINQYNRYFRDRSYLYKCNIYDTAKQIYKLNNIKYKIIQSYENDFDSMIFSQDGSELIIPCYDATIIHKTNNFNEVYNCIFWSSKQIRINY